MTKGHILVDCRDNVGGTWGTSDLDNALSLDDTLFWGSLHLFRNAPDETVRVTANDFFQRKIPPMVDAWKLADEQIARSRASKEMHAHDRVKRIEEACDQACKEILASEEAVLRGCYHDTYNRAIYKPKLENGDAQQINVKVGGSISISRQFRLWWRVPPRSTSIVSTMMSELTVRAMS
ncbi:hypothetical protein [Leisingera sp. F5]|uniref:hypothetical protein n=1 Tax=Leisingera sp. F5 TaxID=1813816 RepID=UPI000B075B91|nr:hypothetical protein [Leisingera sp. F5]